MVRSKCSVVTQSQRCADWFFLQQFRVTGTVAGKIVLQDPPLVEFMGYPSKIYCLGTFSENNAEVPRGVLVFIRSVNRADYACYGQ